MLRPTKIRAIELCSTEVDPGDIGGAGRGSKLRPDKICLEQVGVIQVRSRELGMASSALPLAEDCASPLYSSRHADQRIVLRVIP